MTNSLPLKWIYTMVINALKSYPDWPVWVRRRWRTAAQWRSWLPSCRRGWSQRAGCVLEGRCRELLQCPPHASGWSPTRGKHKRIITINMTAKVLSYFITFILFFSFSVWMFVWVCVCVPYLVIMGQTVEGFYQVCCSLQNNLLRVRERKRRI